MSSDRAAPRAMILGCAGRELSPEEAAFFTASQPFGFILFARNCESPAQVRALVAALRQTVGRGDAPVLIDQEGGRVARLRPPHWRLPPRAADFATLYRHDPAAAIEAVGLNARLIAAELRALGIDVDCAPVLDIPVPGADAIIGDRAFGEAPGPIAALGRAILAGFLAGGVLPVIKHIPGHGRAEADSHLMLPVVSASAADLRRSDFEPFRALRDAPWAMTAHVVYSAFDPDHPATTSAKVIAEVIRGEIGFQGVLLSDDLGMAALEGRFADRAEAALRAGCDLVLHCSGKLDEMREIAAVVPSLSPQSSARIAAASARRAVPGAFDAVAALARLGALLQPVTS